MYIILNLEKVVKVKSLEEAKRKDRSFWKEWGWIEDRYPSVIVDNKMPIGYLSQNGRFWDWDDSEEIKKNPVASNPFTNGSYTNHKYNSFIKEWKNKRRIENLWWNES